MFIEMRTYTLRPGSLARFWELQSERGFEVVRPIMERLISYFGVVGVNSDRVIHFWRYDSHDDWVARLHGLYGKPELDAYFQKVRALMLRQDNMILAAAPLAALTPLLGHGNDWLPSHGPRLQPGGNGPATVSMETIDFLPGTLPAFWSTLASSLREETPDTRLIGTFTSVIGRQHRVITLRTDAGEASPAWATALQVNASAIAGRHSERLTAPPVAAMTPLFTA